MNVYDILNLLGGIALFLFGMHTLSASLEKLAGGKLETWLEKATSRPIKGVVLGAIITAVIQSSAATTVMIIGFVNSGLMKLSQAIGVIMGANIGTTATSWLLSLQSISGSDGFSFLNILKPTTFYTGSCGHRRDPNYVHQVGQEKDHRHDPRGFRRTDVRHELDVLRNCGSC